MIQLLSLDPKERPSASETLKQLLNMYQKKKNFIVGEFPTRRYGHSSVVFENSILYFGGYSAETKASNEFFEFDIDKYEIKTLKVDNNKVKKKFWHSSVIYKNFIYIFGGYGDQAFDGSIMKYDLKKSEWIKVKYTFPCPLGQFSSVLYKNRVYIFGGMDFTKTLKVYNYLLEFDLDNEKIKPITMKENIKERYGHSSVIYGDSMITFGGANLDGNLSSDDNFYELNLTNFKWKKMKSEGETPTPRNGHTMNLFQDKLILFGGLKQFESEKFIFNHDLLYEFNLKTETWKKLNFTGEFPIKSYLHTANIYQDSLYISFGMSWNTHLRNEIYVLNFENMTFKNLNRSQKNLIWEWNRKHGYICIFCVEKIKRSSRYICLECFGSLCETCFENKTHKGKQCDHSFAKVDKFIEMYNFYSSPKAPIK